MPTSLFGQRVVRVYALLAPHYQFLSPVTRDGIHSRALHTYTVQRCVDLHNFNPLSVHNSINRSDEFALFRLERMGGSL